MRTNINFTRKGNYIGRNGHAPMHGLEVLTTANGTHVLLSPINSRGPARSTWFEIPKEDIPNVIEGLTNAMGQDWPRYFHVGTEEGVSLGVIRGKDNEELNTKLRATIHRAFNAEAVAFEEVNFKFWEREHHKEVPIKFTREGDDMEAAPEEQTIVLTYTFMQP